MTISWGYARVSTEEQALDADALGKQIQRLQDAGCSKVYYDIISRTTESRDGLNELIRDLKNCDTGSVQFFKCARIDRIGSSSRLFYSLLEVLKLKKISLVCLEQEIDIDSLGGELTIDILLAASKFEIKMLSHRVKTERTYRTSLGKPNNISPFGFKVENGAYTQNNTPLVCLLATKQEFTHIEVAKLIFDLFAQVQSVGKTCKKIHEYFGLLATGRNKKEKTPNVITDTQTKYTSNHIAQVPLHFSKMTIRNILVSPVYAGGTHYDTYNYHDNGKKKSRKCFTEWNITWDTHQGIISREQHEQIKATIKGNTNNRWAATEDVNPYIRKLTCIYCSGGFVRQYYKKKDGSNIKDYWYQCSNYRDGRCANKKMISEKKLDAGIQKIFILKAVELAEIIQQRMELEAAPKLVESDELIALRKNLNSLRLLQTNEIIEKAIQDTESKIDYLVRNSNVLLPDYVKISELLDLITDDGFWESITVADKKRFLKEFIKKITVDAPNVTDIIFSFRY